MAKLCRPTYTRSIPEAAKIITRDGQRLARCRRDFMGLNPLRAETGPGGQQQTERHDGRNANRFHEHD